MNSKNFKKLALILLVSIIFSGCSIIKKPTEKPIDDGEKNIDNQNDDNSQIITDLKNQGKINKFSSLDELKLFLEEQSGLYSDYYGYSRNMMSSDMMSSDMAFSEEAVWSLPSAGSEMAGKSLDYSETNVQVQGVDESDIIKTDGNHIYALVKNDLHIIKSYPAEGAEILSKIEFKSRPSNVYINGDKLVVFGDNDEIETTDFYKKYSRRSSFVYFKVFDISDKKNPKQLKNFDFEGSYFNSRMIGDYIYFVTNLYSYNYYDGDFVLPKIIEGESIVNNGDCAGNRCVSPNVYYFDIPYQRYNFTTVSAININNLEETLKSEIYLLPSNQNIYVSQNNLYLAYTKYVSDEELMMDSVLEIMQSYLSEKDKEKISKIQAVENFILSPSEKNEKIMSLIESFLNKFSNEEEERLEEELKNKMKQKYQDISKELEKTVIHKIAIAEGKLEYQNYGEVTGTALNQFSMDESGDYFRIATTKNQTWSQFADEERIESYSNLYVLDKDMKELGSVENLAEGERIYSVRFMQNRAYLVTFKQTDPLFTIDLSDPTNPRVLGELKIPGFSNYLHPYDETTLIGIGRDTEETSGDGFITKGVKISLFDVSDITNPKEADTYVFDDSGYSDSIALSDHKAFLFSKEKNLLVIPLSITKQNRSSELEFSGAAVFKIDKTKIELQGKIDHSDKGEGSQQDYWLGYNYYDNTVKRSLYIENILYSFSNNYIKMNNLENLQQINSLRLIKQADDDFKIIN